MTDGTGLDITFLAALNICKNHKTNMNDLIKFVNQETTLAINSILSQEQAESFGGKSEKSHNRKSRKIRAMVIL